MSQGLRLFLACAWTGLTFVLAPFAGQDAFLSVLATITLILAITCWILWLRKRKTTAPPVASRGAVPRQVVPMQTPPPPPPTQVQPATSRPVKPAPPRVSDSGNTPYSFAPLPPYFLLGRYPNMDIEGEFANLDNIAAIFGRKPKIDEELIDEDLTAELRAEPNNPFDRHAVMVLIGGRRVGYLASDDARRYQPIMKRIEAAGYAPTAKARVWMAARRDWDNQRKKRLHANVRVALNEPHQIVPLNDPPTTPYSLLPWGAAQQVTGEEKHLPVLSGYVNAEGDGFALGTLAIAHTTPVRAAPKEIIEVQIDNETIGALTPAMSANFIPTVRHLDQQGLVAAVWLRVKGSPVAVQVTVQAPKAHEIPADWFGDVHSHPRLRTTSVPEPMWDD